MMQEYAGSASHEPRSSPAVGLREGAGEAHEETKSAVRNAYDKTSEVVQSGYNRTIEYSKEHPQRFTLFAFAAGLGAGTLIAARFASGHSHTRTEQIASPLIDAVAEIARAFIRR